jgi:hypothetical protein
MLVTQGARLATIIKGFSPMWCSLAWKQSQGGAQGKQLEGSPNAGNLRGTSSQGNQGVLANVGQSSPGANLNMQ